MASIYDRCKFTVSWLSLSSREAAAAFLADRSHGKAKALVSNHYFTRVWIVQEILKSQHVIDRYAGMNCQDPRDKVFGFVGLVAEGERPEVDYWKTLREVYIDAIAIMSGKTRFNKDQTTKYLQFAHDMRLEEWQISQLGKVFHA
ncbi:hypothetical protein CC86DRAFT_101261 [Ophiobolus disseminans]|uniref:Heterokaryon incompatibility domain-containing protein n=1 Tax=Ophiobolus disseminans TaxID=1469910 RepID=A0A6A6ZL54_9PLEO|nr:hypothetical protein CC86DRAFT_101261 [Ophiobolus disseminans]